MFLPWSYDPSVPKLPLQPSGLLPKDRRVGVNFPKMPPSGSDQRSQHSPILGGACSGAPSPWAGAKETSFSEV